MLNLLNRQQAVTIDNFAMQQLGVNSLILMENAARSSAEIISNYIAHNDNVAIFCGSGNNGGDGFAIARHLLVLGFSNIDIFFIGDSAKMTIETLTNYQIITKLGINLVHILNENDFEKIVFNHNCYIEALIGIGGSENLRGITPKFLHLINKQVGIKISIDIPAGLNSDTGIAHINAFKADFTITMFSPKIGMYINSGSKICGKIHIASLGVPRSIINNYSNANIFEKNDIRKLIGFRHPSTSKFDFGKVLVIAGSQKYPGAAALTANAAVCSGAGLVYLASTDFHSSLFPEVIQVKLQSNKTGAISSSNYDLLQDIIDKCNSIAIGPGLSDCPDTLNLIRELVSNNPLKSIVIDADGLKAVKKIEALNQNIILTPHIYEFANLFDLNHNSITENAIEIVKEKAKLLNCIIHLKLVPSITSNGDQYFLTITGNPGMATGGSGDVLTGIIASFCALGMVPLQAASLGAYVHSLAGDFYTENFSMESLRASDLIDCIKYVLK